MTMRCLVFLGICLFLLGGMFPSGIAWAQVDSVASAGKPLCVSPGSAGIPGQVSTSTTPVAAGQPIAVATSASAGTSADAPLPVPVTVRLDRTGSSPVVLFTHQQHESRGSCKDCHGGKEPRFPKSRSPKAYTMAEMQAGKFCGRCHDGVTAYDVRKRCDICHYKP